MGDIPVEEIFAEEDETLLNNSFLSPSVIYYQVTTFIANYGWYILLQAIFMYIVWQKYLGPKWEKWREEVAARNESARHHRDPDLALGRLQAMEAARQHMQAANDAASLRHVEKMKQKEEEMRAQKIEDWERHKKGLGYCNKTRFQKPESVSLTTGAKGKSTLKNNDYNPLTGSGGSSSFRPAKKGRGGGCPSC